MKSPSPSPDAFRLRSSGAFENGSKRCASTWGHPGALVAHGERHRPRCRRARPPPSPRRRDPPRSRRGWRRPARSRSDPTCRRDRRRRRPRSAVRLAARSSSTTCATVAEVRLDRLDGDPAAEPGACSSGGPR
jgi:hypothetical protein